MPDIPDANIPAGGEFTAVPGPPLKAGTKPPVGSPLSADDLIALNEEIASMAKAGLPLDQGLKTLSQEMGSGRLQATTKQLAEDLAAGFTLPQAIERQRGRVPPYYAALLAAGIRSNRIGEVLGTLTLYARSISDFREAVFNALLYPAIVLVLGFGLIVFVATVILPGYAEIFETMNLKLPALTQWLLFVGRHPLQFLILPPAILIAMLVVGRWCLRATPRGRIIWARVMNAVPVIGTMIRSARLAAFTDLLGILVDQGIPMPEAMRLAAAASTDALLTEGATQIENDVRQGMALGDAFQRQRLVPELVVWMVRFGEKQGTLGLALHQLSQMYRRHAELRIALMRTILPPLLIILLAGFLGIIFIFGLMGPFFELLEGLSGGKR